MTNEEKAPRPDSTRGKANKGPGSFRIPRKAIEILLSEKATAWKIGVFLTIARFTDKSGKFSSAGFNSIYQATGVAPGTEKKPGRGRQLTKELLLEGRAFNEPSKPKKKTKSLCGILYTPEEWQNKTGESIPDIPHSRHSIRWVLNDYEVGDYVTGDWVWFPNSLVDGYGKFKQPLKRMKQYGDTVARLLIGLYSEDNMEEFGGVPPFGNVYQKYDVEHLESSNGFAFWSAKENCDVVHKKLVLLTLGIESLNEDKDKENVEWKHFWSAFESLQSAGFLYECVMAMDGCDIDQDTRPLYDITTKPKHGHPLKGEEGLLKRINRIFEEKDLRHINDSGQFNGRYPVLSLAGLRPQVIGIYRLRFRITNPKNYPVRAGWVRIQKDRNDWLEHIEQLEQVLGIAKKRTL